jgi:large exoprotein involved in heme utilization and adhesion
MFTGNAQVNLGGSFIVSTASYVKFSDGSYFYGDVNHPIQDAGLSSAPVSAFGFLTTPQPVSFAGSQITMPSRTGLHVIGGDITIDQGSPHGVYEQGSNLSAPAGNLTLFSAASTGEVPFSLASPGSGYAAAPFSAFGNITVQNHSTVAIDSAQGGGNVVIRGGRIVVDNSMISSANSGPVAGGNIAVQADTLTLQDAGQIIASTTSSGNAGNVSVTANSLTVDGTNAPPAPGATSNAGLTGIFSNSNAGAGNSGSVEIMVADELTILNSGIIGASAFSTGNAGDVMVEADDLTIDGSASPNVYTGIDSDSNSTATGNGGDVDVITTNSLSLQGAGEISCSTYGTGNAGDVTVQAGTIHMAGSNSGVFSSTYNSTSASAGNAGQVNVTGTGEVDLTSSAQIGSNTQGAGNANDVTIQAGTLSIDGSATPAQFTGVSSDADPGSTGNAGKVNVNVTGNLNLAGGISSDAFGKGNAGDVTVQAASMSIVGSATAPHLIGIDSQSNPGATGNAGKVNVTVTGNLSISGGSAEISTGTFDSGNAGDVTVSAGTLSIDNSAEPNATAVAGILSESSSSDPSSPGNAGVVTVNVKGALSLTGGGEIDTDTDTAGNAGDVIVHAASLTINEGVSPTFTGISSSSEPDATGSGPVSLMGQGEIESSSYSSGNAGNVTVNAESMTIDDSSGPNDPSITGIFSESVSNDSSSLANAGSVTVNVAGALVITGSGDIDSDTETAGTAGDVTVQAGSLTINGLATPDDFTGISSDADADTPDAFGTAGKVSVTVAGALSISGGGSIETDTYASGPAGDVTVQAGSLSIDGSALPSYFTGISSAAGDFGNNPTDITGNGGDVKVTVAGLISITGSGQIDASSYTTGNGGNINVTAGSLTIDGTSEPGYQTGVTAIAYGNGNAGTLSVTVEQTLSILGSGAISAVTDSQGNAGDVTVQAGSLAIDGSSTPTQVTGIFANSVGDGTPGDLTGNAGNVHVTVTGDASIGSEGRIAARTFTNGNAGDLTVVVGGGLDITAGGEVVADTEGTGDAGSIHLTAGSMTIDGSADLADNTGILSGSDDGATGNGGTVAVNVNRGLDIVGGGEISSDTSTSGNAGPVSVSAGSCTINGATAQGNFTGISSSTGSSGASSNDGTGSAGTVSLNVAGNLSVTGGGEIAASSYTSGYGGDVLVQAGSITLDGSSTPAYVTGITAQATSSGNGGNITVDGGSITLTRQATISASSSISDAGNILINAESLSLQSKSNIDTSAGMDGGSITINAGSLVYLLDSDIQSAAYGGPGTTGGNITIDPQFVVLDNSLISANDFGGTGGNISIITNDFLNNGSMITATGTTAGTITISAPDLNLSGSLIGLPAVLESEENRLREKCARARNHEFSSFIVVGRGGTESAPDELQPDFGMEVTPLALESTAKSSQ